MKITIVGAGNVGSTAGLVIAKRGLGDVLLVDIVEGIPQGKALDIQHAIPLYRSGVRVRGTNDFSDMKDSDVVVITAGIARKPGMSRDDLLKVNEGIVRSVARNIREHAPDSVVVVVTNPLDAMVYAVMKETGFPPKRVMGMSGVLDSTRFRAHISEVSGVSPEHIEAMVLGGHGDSMVPLVKHTKIEGKPITEILDRKVIDDIVKRTQNAGAEVVSHLKTGSAYYAPGVAIAEMVEAISKDSGRVLPASAYLQGEYGYSDIYLGVPVMLGGEGVMNVVELELSEKERGMLDRSAQHVRELLAKLGG